MHRLADSLRARVKALKTLPMPPRPVLYYLLALLVGLLAMELLLVRLHGFAWPQKAWWEVLFWGGVVAWSQRIAVRLPLSASISQLFVIALALVLLFPSWFAPLLVFAFYLNPDLGKPSYPWFKDLFNRTQNALATGLAALVWRFFEENRLHLGNWDLSAGLGILGASLGFFLLNITLVSVVIYLATGSDLKKIWLENYRWLAASYLLLSPMALLLARGYENPLVAGWGGWTVLFFLIPLYYSRHYWDEAVRLREALDTSLQLLMNALDAKDPQTRLHSERVASIAKDLTQAYLRKYGDTLEKNKILDPDVVYKGARIHDIGKIGLPDAILFKPGPLSPEERALMESHPVRGVKLMEPAKVAFTRAVYEIIRHHHERWDGRGYPDRLSGHEIPLEARIVALADAYEAMTAGRPYRRAKTPEEALKEVQDFSGIQFDPRLVELFTELWHQNPIWRDREVFLSLSTSPQPSLEWPSPSPSAQDSRTLDE
ncbi:HD-GYP domain-containing protein [Thermus filiformis]|nr:HD domain-containing phosphohydrolase [Thermus filiformis]